MVRNHQRQHRSAMIAVVVAERPATPLGSGAAVGCRGVGIAAAAAVGCAAVDDAVAVAASALPLGAPRLAGGSVPRRAGRLLTGD